MNKILNETIAHLFETVTWKMKAIVHWWNLGIISSLKKVVIAASVLLLLPQQIKVIRFRDQVNYK